jgi:asparagine synthetase B (glutamine-hydrolysing)
MCGIVGIWNLDGLLLDRSCLNRFNNSLAHRGLMEEAFISMPMPHYAWATEDWRFWIFQPAVTNPCLLPTSNFG